MKTIFFILMLFLSSHFFAQVRYVVNAESGLIIRKKPTSKSEKTGKFNYKDTIVVKKEIRKRADTIQDNKFTIPGYWIQVKTKENVKGYVFEGFIKKRIEGNNKRAKLKLYGPVKSITKYNIIYHYKKSKDSLYEGKTDYEEKIILDKNGNLLERYSYHWDNKIYLDYTRKYDANNHLLEHTNMLKGEISTRETYVYNKEGLLIERNKFYGDKPYYKWMYTYDEKGNTIEEEDYYYDKMRSKRWKMSFDENNNKTLSKFYNYNEQHKLNFHYLYDSKKRILKRTEENLFTKKTIPIEEFKYQNLSNNNRQVIRLEYNNEGKLKDKFIRRYDSIGNMTEYLEYKEGSIDLYYGLKRTIKGNNKMVKRYDKNGLTDKDEYVYDYKGNLLMHQDFYTSEERKNDIYNTTFYTYIFDKYSNWIVKKEFRGKLLKKVYYRDLKYY